MAAWDRQREDGYHYAVFRDCISGVIGGFLESPASAKSAGKKRRRTRTKEQKAIELAVAATETSDDGDVRNGDDGDLAEFVEYIASELFATLPPALQTVSYSADAPDPSTTLLSAGSVEAIADLAPAAIAESLAAYGLAPVPALLSAALPAYVAAAAPAPPPVWSATRAAACELCARDWVPLTYHHLVPRSTHERALKRGWHAEWELNKVAWLCAACHRCVHRVASNEELAQEWHTVEALLEREDVRRFVDWVGRVRWKKR